MSLARALAREPSCRRAGIVACVDEPGERHPPEVVAELVSGSPYSIDAAAAELRRFDVVVVQHEFGIYGGKDGGEIVDLVRRLDVPSIVVLHTVPVRPSPNERAILEQLACLSGCLVAQSAAAWSRLVAGYDVRRDRVHVIPHGAVVNLGLAGRPRATGHRPVILTWGLLGPGKGIEYGIQAVAQLRDLDPKPRYVVLGETHPRVIAAQGETYRMALRELARSLAVEDLVELRDVYLKPKVLLAAIRMADVVLLPYLDRDQIVSGVLAEAIASGKPVVATGFPHAVELLRGGAGVVLPHEDSGAIAAALRSLLTDDDRALRAAAAARQQAEKLSWENVAGAYVRLISAQPARRVAVHR